MPRPSTAITVLALAASTNAFLPLKARVNRLVKMQAEEKPHATVIFLRHGQSVWNEASLFTGWADVELTTLGKNEAAAGATSMWKEVRGTTPACFRYSSLMIMNIITDASGRTLFLGGAQKATEERRALTLCYHNIHHSSLSTTSGVRIRRGVHEPS